LVPLVHFCPCFTTEDFSFGGITFAFAGSFAASLAAVAFAFPFGVEAALDEDGLDVLDGVLAVVGVPLAAAPDPPLLTVMTGSALRAGELLLVRPISTPTPMASKSVATPAIRVALAVIHGRRRPPEAADGRPELDPDPDPDPAIEYRGFPRRSPHSTQ
jgi:hypothetical protein